MFYKTIFNNWYVKYGLTLAILSSSLLFFTFYYQFIPLSITGSMDLDIAKDIKFDNAVGRSLGYPYFMHFVSLFSENILILKFFQLFLFSFSIIFLSREFYFLTSNKAMSFILGMTILLNVKVSKYGFTVTEEALFIPLIIIITSLIIRVCININIRNVILLSLMVGLLVSIRPIGIVFVPVLFIIFLLNLPKIRKKKILYLSAFIVPLIILTTLENYLFLMHTESDYRARTIGVNLIGKTPQMAINKPKNSHYPSLSNLIYDKGMVVRKIIDSQDSFALKQYFRNVLAVEYHDIGSMDKDMHNEIGKYSKRQKHHSREEVTQGIFNEYLEENFSKYFEITMFNYLANWHLSEILTEGDLSKLKEFTNSRLYKDMPKSMDIGLNHHIKVLSRHAKYAVYAKIFMITVFIVSVVIFVLGLFNFLSSADKTKVSPFDLLLIIFPLSLHGYLLAISLIINVQMRFILTFWPIIMVIFSLLLLKIMQVRKV
jgi:hypothetical protein